MKNNRMIILTALAAGLVLGGCGEEQGAAGGGGWAMPPSPVETAGVSTGAVADRFTAVGTVEAAESITVSSEIDGVVTALPFPEGGPMAAGQTIARLDDDQLRAEAQRARAVLDLRRASWQRVRNVVEGGAGTPQDLDDALANLKVAEADLALAETRLAKATITAPFAGHAGKRRVSVGAFVRAGSALTDLARVDRLRVVFAVPERLMDSVRAGLTVRVGTTAFPDLVGDGVVDFVAPQLDPGTRNVTVVALVENPDGRLRPGMSASVELLLAERPGALTIPSQAVFVEAGQAFVYAVGADSVVAKTPVALGSRLTGAVEVVSGLEADARVVAAGHQKLYPGAKVLPVPAGEGEAR